MKRHDFRGKKITEHVMCVLIFSATFVRNICRSMKKCEKHDNMLKTYNRLRARYPIFLSDVKAIWIFSTDSQ